MPVGIYLEPSLAAEGGLGWDKIIAQHEAGPDTGLYGRAVLVDANQLTDDADPELAARLKSRYRCTASPCGQVVKIEYWQFYGFSHDLDAAQLGLVARPRTTSRIMTATGAPSSFMSMPAGGYRPGPIARSSLFTTIIMRSSLASI